MSEPTKRYTVTLKITRDECPEDEKQIWVEQIGWGEINAIYRSESGRWIIEASFQVEEFTEVMALLDKRVVSRKLH